MPNWFFDERLFTEQKSDVSKFFVKEENLKATHRHLKDRGKKMVF